MKISKEFKVGLLAVVAITILYLGFNFLKGIDFFSATNQYYAVYDEIDGLNLSNDVILNGLAVGRVSDIKILPNRNNQIVVELDVDSRIVLGDSTVALLKNNDVLGTKAIELVVEDRLMNQVNDGDTLLSRLDRGIASVLLEKAAPVADDLSTTIRNVNIILENLANNSGRINNALANIEETTEALRNTVRNNQQEVNRLLNSYNDVALDLSKTLREAPPLLIKTSQLIDSLQNLEVAQTLRKTEEAIESLNSAIAKIDGGEGTLGRLINDDSLYANLNKAAEDLDRLLIDLRENPNRYVHFSVFGRSGNNNSSGGEQ